MTLKIENDNERGIFCFKTRGSTIDKKVIKGAWRMPRLSEAKKDVISCDKLRVSANNL